MASIKPWRSFKYIRRPTFEHKAADVIQTAYEDRIPSFTTYTRGSKDRMKKSEYRVWESIDAFCTWFGTANESTVDYNEVIFGGSKQKLKFDIDAISSDLVDACPDDVDAPAAFDILLRAILGAISDIAFTTWMIDVAPENLIICRSFDPNDVKYSAHIIVPGYCVRGYADAAEFTKRVIATLLPWCRTFVDRQINRRLGNFRIAGSAKPDGRVKEIIGTKYGLKDTLITCIENCEDLRSLVTAEESRIVQIDPESPDVQTAIALCKTSGLLADHKYRTFIANTLMFDRTASSFCDICMRAHDKDNTLVVNLSERNGYISLWRSCRHKPIDAQNVFIGGFNSATTESAGTEFVRKSILAQKLPKLTSLFDKLPDEQKLVYDEPALRPFELAPTLVVEAAMKMGKTKMLKQYLAAHFKDTPIPRVVRFVSFRQTFSSNIKEKFADFTLYSDVIGPLKQSRVIVQVESLWRLDLDSAPPDLLILDECESIIEQFDSGLLRGNFDMCFAKFKYLLQYSKHVICMDAHVGDRTYNVLQRLRPSVPIKFHKNIYKNARNDQYYLTHDKVMWLSALKASVAAGDKIALPITSLTEARAIETVLKTAFPQKSIKLYSSETTMREKKEHFGDVDKYWSQYDVMIYTPTISAGVSFESAHFDRIFAYFIDTSCPIETCVQMIGRIRNVCASTFYVCIQAHKVNVPTTTDGIRADLYNDRARLFGNMNDNIGLRMEYNVEGQVEYFTSDYFYVWLENTRVRNLSRRNFALRFRAYIETTGATTMPLTEDELAELEGDIDPGIYGEVACAKSQNRATRSEQIAAAPELSEEEADQIRAAMNDAAAEIKPETMRAYDKWRLRRNYSYIGAIDDKFVRRYDTKNTLRVFKNLIRIGPPGTDACARLRQIHAEERAAFNLHTNNGAFGEQLDLRFKYVFEQHRIAHSLLQLFGWSDLFSGAYKCLFELATNMRANEPVYHQLITDAFKHFNGDIKFTAKEISAAKTDAELIRAALEPVNTILRIMYDARICAQRDDLEMFHIRRTNLFTYAASESHLRPHIYFRGD